MGQDTKKLKKECLDLWQKIVKLKAGNKCEFPGCHRKEHLNAHHFFRRQHTSVLVDPDNGLALCPTHHTLGKESAHHDPDFKDKILGRLPGYKPIRTEQWYKLLFRKAWTPQKLDWQMEKLYLRKELERYRKLSIARPPS
jgi:hypothetical protein